MPFRWGERPREPVRQQPRPTKMSHYPNLHPQARPDTGSLSRNDSIENGERDRHGRSSRHRADWSAEGKRFTKRYSFSRRNVFGQRPKAAGATPALPSQIESVRLRISGDSEFLRNSTAPGWRGNDCLRALLRARCPNPGARPSWPQHIHRLERRLIMAWPFIAVPVNIGTV